MTHSRIFLYLKRKFISFRYFKTLNLVVLIRYRINFVAASYREKYKKIFYLFYYNFFFLYASLFLNINKKVFSFAKKRKKKYKRVFYHLILTFRNNKLFFNINDSHKRNYFFISTGFFIKFFDKKKLYKKSKLVRSLMIKHLRKIFLLIRIPRLVLVIKNNPTNLLEFLKLFNTEIPHKFYEPVTNKEVLDNGTRLTKFLYFVFSKNTSYVKNKTRKKGRVKRKIFRKIVRQNLITD